MTDRLSDERLQHLIDFTSATSSEANSILFELKSLRLLVTELKEDGERLAEKMLLIVKIVLLLYTIFLWLK